MTDHGHADRQRMIGACSRHRGDRIVTALAPYVLACVIGVVLALGMLV